MGYYVPDLSLNHQARREKDRGARYETYQIYVVDVKCEIPWHASFLFESYSKKETGERAVGREDRSKRYRVCGICSNRATFSLYIQANYIIMLSQPAYDSIMIFHLEFYHLVHLQKIGSQNLLGTEPPKRP